MTVIFSSGKYVYAVAKPIRPPPVCLISCGRDRVSVRNQSVRRYDFSAVQSSVRPHLFKRRRPETLFRLKGRVEFCHIENGRNQTSVCKFKQRKRCAETRFAFAQAVTIGAMLGARVTVQLGVGHFKRPEDPSTQNRSYQTPVTFSISIPSKW